MEVKMKKIDMSKVKSITLKSALGGSDPPTVKMAPRVDGWSTDFDGVQGRCLIL
jgi:hypothetical protein